MVTLFYTAIIGTHLFSNTILFDTMAECIYEKDRIEQYHIQEYSEESYEITLSCSNE